MLVALLLGSLVGAALGLLSVQFLAYLRQLLRQPRLVDPPNGITGSVLALEPEIRAASIAAVNVLNSVERRRLASGGEVLILNAGRRNFREPWARDFGFASFGLAELQSKRVLREGLEMFLRYQVPDGQFPVKMHSTSVLNRYLHAQFGREQPIHAPLRPKFRTGHDTLSLDGNALLVIASANYLRLTGERAWLDARWEALGKGLDWLGGHAGSDGLLKQQSYSDWADTVARNGRVLYTNVVYWKAIEEMQWMAGLLDRQGAQASYAAQAERVCEAVQRAFWRADEGHFAASDTFELLSSSGNLLAIAWGLAEPEQGHQILDEMERRGMADPVPTRATDRPYPPSAIALENRLGGLASYHTEAAWLWLGAWHVIALCRFGRMEEAREILSRIASTVVRDGVIHEVYGPDGRPLSSFWYQSEAPLTWNAAMVFHACRVYARWSGLAPAARSETAPPGMAVNRREHR